MSKYQPVSFSRGEKPMSYRNNEHVLGLLLLIVIGIPVALLVVLALIMYPFQSYKCQTRWPDYPNRYNIIAGCLVQTKKDGMFISDDRIWFENGQIREQ